MIEVLLAALLAIGSAVAPHPPGPAPQEGLSITVDTASDFRPVLRLRGVLDDRELEEATRSGLPLRLAFRVELWRDGFIDDLAATESWNAVLLFEPLDRQYIVRPRSGRALRFASYDYAFASGHGFPSRKRALLSRASLEGVFSQLVIREDPEQLARALADISARST